MLRLVLDKDMVKKVIERTYWKMKRRGDWGDLKLTDSMYIVPNAPAGNMQNKERTKIQKADLTAENRKMIFLHVRSGQNLDISKKSSTFAV